MKQTKRAEAHLSPEDRKLLDFLAHYYGTEAQALRMALRAHYKELTQ